MNVAAYARVATQRQAEEQTITQQIARLQAKAHAEGWTLAPQHLYRDEGYSGARIDRPALDRLRDAAERGEFQVVVITAPDRLAWRFVHQTLLLEELAQGGCTVVFLDRPISQDPHDQLLLQIRGAVAEYERALIADRPRRGRLAKLRAGQLLPWINTPYGYRCDPQYPRDPARLRIEETEAQVIRQMFTWYAEEGLSIHAIAARLMSLQIPTYRGGRHWHPASVGGMLRNEVYAGTAYGNRDYEVEPQRWRGGRSAAERLRHHTRHRPREEWIPVEVPPLISRDLFERVQALRPLRQAQSPRNNTRHEYRLRARVSCAVCGLAVSGRPEGKHAYYSGNGHLSRVQTGRSHCCTVRAIRVDRLDPLVWEDVSRLLSTPLLITEALRKAQAGELLHDEASERLRQLQRARQKAQRQIERLVDAFSAEVLTLEELQTRRTGLQERLRILTQQEQDVHRHHHQQLRLTELETNIETLCRAVRTGLQTLAFAGRRQIIELLVDRVLISHDEIEIRYAVPLTGWNPAGKKETLRLPYRANGCMKRNRMSAREEILHLINRYTFTIDTGDLEGFASLFEYGEWIMKDAEPIVGRRQVWEAIARIRIYEDGTPRTKHVTSNIDVDIDEESGTAKSECYVTVFQQTEGFPLQPIFSGHYFFDFACVDGAWRFTKREIRYGLVGDLSAHLKAPSEIIPNP